MPTTIKYIGTADNYAELAITGKQSVWQVGQQEERTAAEAALLLSTGMFSTPSKPVTATANLTGGSDFLSEVSTLKLPAGVTDLTAGFGGGGGASYNLKARHIEDFGAAVGGFWDAAFAAAMTAAYLCGGIKLMLLNEQVYALSGTFPTIPNNGETAPQTVPVILQGAGCHWSGRGKSVLGSTVLDIRGASSYGKITLTSLGLFGLRDLTLTDTTASGGALVYTTNATLDIQGCAFAGITSGINATQDAIICGGTLNVEGDDGVNDGFQGYGTVIQRNFFHNIRRAFYGRKFFNGAIVKDNTVWTTCGASDNTPCFEIDGDPTNNLTKAIGNTVTGNLIEMVNYAYGVKIENSERGYYRNTFFDKSAKSLAAYYLGYAAGSNRIDETYTSTGMPIVSDNSQYKDNAIYRLQSSEYSKLKPTDYPDIQYPLKAATFKVYGGVSAGFKIQPDQTLAGGVSLGGFYRSAAEGTDPGKQLLEVTNGGDIKMYLASFQTGGNIWKSIAASGTGQNMTWDSGSGGSYNDIKGFAIRHYDHTGALCATLTSAASGWVIARPMTWKPAASQTPASNGDLTFEATSNTSLTVKYKGSDGTVRSTVLTLA